MKASIARATVICAAVLGLCAVGPAVADIVVLTPSYTLEQAAGLTGGLRVADKVFSNFSFTDTSKNGGNAPDPSSISVEGVKVTYGTREEIGLRFTGGWSAFNTQIADTVIRFKVAADAPYLISDNTLWMSAFGHASTGQSSISETIYKTYPPTVVGDLVVSKYAYSNALASQFLQHVDYGSAYSQLWAVVDVNVNGGATSTGSSHISEFYVTFSQVPEPASLSLLGLGGAALLRRRRR